MVDLARIEPIASHHAILLHDRHVRSPVALGQEPQRRDRRPIGGCHQPRGRRSCNALWRAGGLSPRPSPESSVLWPNPSAAAHAVHLMHPERGIC